MLQRSILCMQGTQYATKRSILCRGAFCGPTMQQKESILFGSRVNLVEIVVTNFIRCNQ